MGVSLPKTTEGEEKHFAAGYERSVIVGVGHFIQRENPQSVIDAVLG